MPMFPISEAAKRANVERTTLYRRIKRGEISCQTDESGNKTIEASELLRVYPHADISEDFGRELFGLSSGTFNKHLARYLEEPDKPNDFDKSGNWLRDMLKSATEAATDEQQSATEIQQQFTLDLLINAIKVRDEKIRNFEQERERERQNARETIEDLRRRLDQEAEERRRLTLLLTDQRPQAPQKPVQGRFSQAWGILTGNK